MTSAAAAFTYDPPLKEAFISEDGLYRYWLTRVWDDKLPFLLWLMLNPSTADHKIDDPTIRRVISFTRAWGYGGAVVANMCAYRSAYPEDLITAQKQGVDIVGPENYLHMKDLVKGGDVIVGWGANAAILPGPAAAICNLLHEAAPKNVWHLGLSKDGHPKHPLYLKATTPRQPFDCQMGLNV